MPHNTKKGYTVPEGLGTVQDLIKRFNGAERAWELWRSLHQEAFDFAAPNRQTLNYHTPGQQKDRQIFDGTAIRGVETFKNKIMGSTMPAWMQWVDFTAGDDIEEDDKERVTELLEDITKSVFAELNHSNYYTEVDSAMTDYAVGTGAIMIEEEDFLSDRLFKFSNVPLAELYPEEPGQGPIRSVWRKQKVSPRNVMKVWPRANIPDILKKRAEKPNPADEVFLNGILEKDGIYHQVVIHMNTKSLIFTQSFSSQRLIVFRADVTPGEVFGRGPVIKNLPDIRTLNVVKQFILKHGAINIAGIYTGVDDGIFNPHTARAVPGAVWAVSSNATANPTIRRLDPAGDPGLGQLILKDLQEDIKKAFFSEPMGDFDDPVRTATEQMARLQEMLKERGASFGRLKSELIEPLMTAIVDIMASRGKIPQIRIDGREVTLKHQSPLAKAEMLEDFQNIQVWMADNAANIPQEALAIGVKLEDYPRITSELLGITSKLVRDEDEVKDILQKTAGAAQQQEAQQ